MSPVRSECAVVYWRLLTLNEVIIHLISHSYNSVLVILKIGIGVEPQESPHFRWRRRANTASALQVETLAVEAFRGSETSTRAYRFR